MITKLVYGNNRKGVWLREEELKGLALLQSLKYLSVESLYKYVTSIGSYKVKYKSFRDRVRKNYVKWGLVHRHFYSYGQNGFGYVYLSIKQKGVELLIDRGLLHDEETDKQVFAKLTKGQEDHTLAAREIVVDVLVEEMENAAFTRDLTFAHHSANKMVYHHPLNKEHILVMPDWIIQNGQRILNLELDTGKQNLKIIKDKIRMYAEYASFHSEKEHIVFFSVLDHTFRSRTDYGSREKRVESLKQAISELEAWKSQDNLQVYVIPYNRTYELAYKVLTEPNDMKQLNASRQKLGQSIKSLLSYHGQSVEVIDVFGASSFDLALDFTCNGVQTTVYALILREGSVTDFIKAETAQAFIMSSVPNQKTRLLFVYSSEKERDSDVQTLLMELNRIAYIDSTSIIMGREAIVTPKTAYSKKDDSLIDWLSMEGES